MMKNFNSGKIMEGINKIEVVLHPCLNHGINYKSQIDPDDYLTLHRSITRWGQYCLSIHEGFINQKISILENIANAIYELVKKEVITILDEISTQMDFENYCFYRPEEPDVYYIDPDAKPKKCYYQITRDFIFKHLEYFVGKIIELDIFFDFPGECIEINKNSNYEIYDLNNAEHLKKMNNRRASPAVSTKLFVV
jgi:hypothetical protein